MTNWKRILVFFGLVVFLSACGTAPEVQDGAPGGALIDVAKIHNAVPKRLPRSQYGNAPYCVLGQCYKVMVSAAGYKKQGVASWYGTKFDGHQTSNRETYDLYAMTAASRNLPIPTFVRVTNLRNGRQVVVRVNDRGPFVKNRIIDLSYAAAVKLGYANRGTAPVRVEAINPWVKRVRAANRRTRQEIQAPAKQPSQFYVQIGAFSSRQSADQLSQRINNWVHNPIQVKEEQGASQPVYKVRIGPMLTAAKSDRIRQLLREHGVSDSMVFTS